jgi:hypothetical protein
MFSLKKSMDEKKFDTRLIELHLQTGKITQKEYYDFLKSLEDSQDNAVTLQIEDTHNTKSSSPLN